MMEQAEAQREESRVRTSRGVKWPAAGIAGLAAIITVAGIVRAAEPASSVSPAALSAGSQPVPMPSFADLVQRVSPAVVSVYVSAEQPAEMATLNDQEENVIPPGSPFEFFFKQFGQPGFGVKPQIVQAQGSGFFISSRGYILTNNHVVDHAKTVSVKTSDGQSYAAKVIGTDAKTDLAVLKVEKKGDFPYVAFANTVPRIGDWVLAVGNPFGLGGTVTAGIVSAQGRDIGSGPYDDFLQIDAPVNKGNSGGPTFNLQGQVVGINTAIFSPSGGSVGIAFDIPASTAKTVAAELESKGKVTRGWIGVVVQPVTQDVADSLNLKQAKGALIDQVQAGAPAAKAGLAPSDVVMSVDGTAIADARDLARKVAAIDPGKTIAMQVWHEGHERTLHATVAALPNDATPQAEQHKKGENTLGLWLAPAAGVQGAGTQGVVVMNVDPEGKAAEKGIRTGDIILEVGGKKVSTPQEVRADLDAASKHGLRAVLLRIKSASAADTHFVAVPLA
jgi:serine protease Do